MEQVTDVSRTVRSGLEEIGNGSSWILRSMNEISDVSSRSHEQMGKLDTLVDTFKTEDGETGPEAGGVGEGGGRDSGTGESDDGSEELGSLEEASDAEREQVEGAGERGREEDSSGELGVTRANPEEVAEAGRHEEQADTSTSDEDHIEKRG
jgi:hypothetical protein